MRKVILMTVCTFLVFAALSAAVLFSGGETVNYAGGPVVLDESHFANGPVRVRVNDAEFYPRQYLSPADIAAGNFTPEHFSQAEYGTERIVLRLPDKGLYAITFILPGLAGRVYINGALEKETGTLGETVDEVVMDYPWCVFYARPQNNEIELVIQAANVLTYNRVISLPEINISPAGQMKPEDYLYNRYSILTMGVLFVAAMLLMGLWLLYPDKTQNILFGFICLVEGLRAGLNGDSLHRIFFEMPYEFSVRLLYALLPVLVTLIVRYLNIVFPGSMKPIKTAIVPVCAVYVLGILLLPLRIIMATFTYGYIAIGLLVTWSVIRIAPFVKKPSLSQFISLAGLVMFFISALLDLFLFTSIEFFYYRWTPNNTFSEIWLVFFAVTQLISVFMQNIDETVQTTVKNTALERLDKLKTEFMGNMSHELKTPLSVITGYAHLADMSLAEEGGAVSAEVSRKLKLIASESERLGLMVSQILTATRIDEGRLQMNFELCDPAETVHAVLETYYAILNKNNNRLQADIDQDVPPVMADRHRLSQVIVNLISNALKHVSDGTITVSLWEKEGCVYFAVRDTGTGIAPELLPHLFSRYVGDEQQPDTRDTGTGLGLFICKHIVEGHGGEISIESRLGEGTAVTFYIPAAEM